MARKPKQLVMTFGWGGWRPGAGRKPSKRRDKIVLHRARPEVSPRHPMHLTLRVHRELGSLRAKKKVAVMRQAFRAACARDGFRIVDWSIQSNHLHLLVEADSGADLARGMQSFCVRTARGLNRWVGRRGAVFTERYHVRVLKTPREVRNCRAYVLNNYRRHAAQRGTELGRSWVDPCSSWAWLDGWQNLTASQEREAARERAGPAPVAKPESWLMRVGWRRHGLIRTSEVPSQCAR